MHADGNDSEGGTDVEKERETGVSIEEIPYTLKKYSKKFEKREDKIETHVEGLAFDKRTWYRSRLSVDLLQRN